MQVETVLFSPKTALKPSPFPPISKRMRSITLRAALAWAVSITTALAATATTSGLTPSAASLSFSYQVNAPILPTSQTLTIAATGTAATLALSVAVVSTPSGWLTVTPDSGRAPLGLSVSVNPTGLAPGSYTGLITVNTVPAGSNPASVAVTLSVRKPRAHPGSQPRRPRTTPRRRPP